MKVAAVALIAMAAGCATSDALNNDNLAVAAGFKVVTPKKPDQQAILAKLNGNTLFDPCCGAGAILDVADDIGFSASGYELQPHLAAIAEAKGHIVTCGDALVPGWIWPKADLIVSNPPYTLAEAFLRRSLKAAPTVSFLLRLGFLASEERAPLFAEIGMPDVDVVKRPSFCMTVKCKDCGDRYTLPPESARPTLCRHFVPPTDVLSDADEHPCFYSGRPSISTTDAADYAWMTWGTGIRGRVSRLDIVSDDIR